MLGLEQHVIWKAKAPLFLVVTLLKYTYSVRRSDPPLTIGVNRVAIRVVGWCELSTTAQVGRTTRCITCSIYNCTHETLTPVLALGCQKPMWNGTTSLITSSLQKPKYEKTIYLWLVLEWVNPFRGQFRCQMLLLRSTKRDTTNNLLGKFTRLDYLFWKSCSVSNLILASTRVGDSFRKSFPVSNLISMRSQRDRPLNVSLQWSSSTKIKHVISIHHHDHLGLWSTHKIDRRTFHVATNNKINKRTKMTM